MSGERPATVIALEPVQEDAAGLRAALADALAAEAGVNVAAQAVVRVSTPCLQVLVAAERAFRAAGQEFVLAGPSEALIAAFEDLGLFPVLMDWTVAA